ncbi:MAG: hypothetical protein FWD76_02755 [Firmicutes bacterium]|nr:hypothetical protein [Bacillota bacterium]
MASSKEVGRNLSALERQIQANKQAVKDTNMELRVLDKALKLDPGNIDLIKQKYEVFNSQAGLGRERVQQFGEQIEVLDAKLQNGSLTQEQYNTKVAQIAEQSRLATIEVDALTTAVDGQDAAMKRLDIQNFNAGIKSARQSMAGLTTVIGGVSAAFHTVNSLIKNWDNMGWFEAAITGITAALTGLATIISITQVALKPMTAALIALGIGTVVGALSAAGAFKKPNAPQQDSGTSGPSTGWGAYSSSTNDVNNAINQYQSPMQQRSSGSMDLNINVSGATSYNQQK